MSAHLERRVQDAVLVPDFDRESIDPVKNAVPNLPPIIAAQRGNSEAIHAYQRDAATHPTMIELVFVAKMHRIVTLRLEAIQQDPGRFPLRIDEPSLFLSLGEKIGREKYEAFRIQERRHCECMYWTARLENIRAQLGKAFRDIAGVTYANKAKSPAILVRDLISAGGEEKLVLPVIEALKRKGFLREFYEVKQETETKGSPFVEHLN